MSTPAQLLPPPPDDAPAPAPVPAAPEHAPGWDRGRLAPGELAELVVDGTGVDPDTLPPAARAALEARRAAGDTADADADLPVRERALRILGRRLAALESIIRSTTSQPSEVTAAMAQIARIADAYSDSGAVGLRDRPLSTLTHAELAQRIAEIDQRRAQLLARIAAETPTPTPQAGAAPAPRRGRGKRVEKSASDPLS